MVVFFQYFAFLPENQNMGRYKYIHTKHIEVIAAGENEFIFELIDIFLSQIPDFISKMKSSLEAQEWVVLAKEAHTAKSSVLTFGMEETGTILKNIQIKAENNVLEEIPALVNDAIKQMEASIAELLDFKSSLKN